MENNEMIAREEEMDDMTEQDYATETYEETRGISGRDALTIAAGTLVGAAVVKWIAKKIKPVVVKAAVKFVKKNGHTVVPNELLDNYEEDSVDESEEIVEDED